MAQERRVRLEKRSVDSPLRKQIEKRLKGVFDPYGVFI
jgi:hypothetical protein